MEGSVGIIPVVSINVPSMVIIQSPTVIMYIHTTDPANATVVIADVNITNLVHTAIIVVIDAYILYLNYSTVIIILCIRTVVVSRVEGNAVFTACYLIFNVKIEFTVGVNRKRNAIFDKDE